MKYSISTRVIRIDRRSPVADLLNRPIKDGLPVAIFDHLAARFPNYRNSETALELERPIGHPDLDELLSSAVESGAIVQANRSDAPAQVEVRDYVVYSTSEISSAYFVECEVHEPRFQSTDTCSDDDGLGIRYFLSRHSSKSEGRAFGAMGNLFHVLAVRGEARSNLESAKLKHLQLVPVLTDAPDGSWPSDVEPLYIVWSDYELPPVTMPVFDNYGSVYPPEGRPKKIERGCYPLDGYEINPRLKYGSIDVEAFDIARSYERFGGDQPCYHKLIYSQTARRVLEDIGMKLELRPVRIVPREK